MSKCRKCKEKPFLLDEPCPRYVPMSKFDKKPFLQNIEDFFDTDLGRFIFWLIFFGMTICALMIVTQGGGA